MKYFRLILPLLIVAACSSQKKALVDMQSPTQEVSLDLVVGMMSGHFDSSLQAKNDSDYYNISLIMEPIWEGQFSDRYLYVEQSVVGFEKPYRQRIYKVSALGDERFESAIYLLDADSLYIGAWKDKRIFESKRPEDFEVKEGCSVFLKWEKGFLKGSTHDDDCKSDFRGASYTTSEVVIAKGLVESWDRGFDQSGKQVWGAEKGAYTFIQK